MFCSSSMFLFLINKVAVKYYNFEMYLDRIFNESSICRLNKALRSKINNSFRNSLLGRITEIKRWSSVSIVENSRYIKVLLVFYRSFSSRIVNYLSGSKVIGLFLVFKQAFYLVPVKTGSVIIIIVILTNLILSLLSDLHIGLTWLLLQGVFLFISYNGLYSDICWEELNKTSYFLRYLNK